MNTDFVVAVVMGVLGAALVTGGIVVFLRSARTGVKAAAAAAVAAGVVILLFLVLGTPTVRTTGPNSQLPHDPVPIVLVHQD